MTEEEKTWKINSMKMLLFLATTKTTIPASIHQHANLYDQNGESPTAFAVLV